MNRLFLLTFLLPALALAQDAKEPEKIAATEVETLMEREGDLLIVTGFVDRTGTSGAGINFLNFKDSEFVAITFASNVAKFEKPPADLFEDKWVEIQGKISIFKGKPQIKLEEPSQIKIVEKPKGEPKPTAEASPAPAAAEPKPEPPPAPTPKPKPILAAGGVEIVDGKPAVDWKQYFSN